MRRPAPPPDQDLAAARTARGARLTAAWWRWESGERSQGLVEELAAVIVECLAHHEKPVAYRRLRLAASRWANDGPGEYPDPDAAEVVARVSADGSWLSEYRHL